MLNASQAAALSKEATKKKNDERLEKILKEVDNDIREVSSVGGTSVAFAIKEKDQPLLKEVLTTYGYTILPCDPDLDDEHIIFSWDV